MKIGLTRRILIAFVAFAAGLVLTVGILSYRSGRDALRAAAVSAALSNAVTKERALDEWVSERRLDVEALIAPAYHLKDVEMLW